MMVFETPDPKTCGIVALDRRGMVTSFHEKVASPPGNLANAAVYILEPSVLDFMASLGKAEIDFSTEVIPQYMGKIFTYHNTLYHRDIGTVSSWREAHRDFPAIPASAQNSHAWTSILSSFDSGLDSMMEQVMAAE